MLIKIKEAPLFQSFVQLNEVNHIDVSREYTLSEICSIVVDGELNPEEGQTTAIPFQHAWLFCLVEHDQSLIIFHDDNDVPIDLIEHSQYNRKDPYTIV